MENFTRQTKANGWFFFHSHNMIFQLREVQKVLSTLRNSCQSFKLYPSATTARVQKKEIISHPTHNMA